MKITVPVTRYPECQGAALTILMDKGRAAFYAMRQAAAEAGIQDMSLDEINEEIRLAREGR